MRKITSIALMLLAANAYAGAAPTKAPAHLFRPCEGKDVVGLWKTVSVKESPEGDLTKLYKTMPHEYMNFGASDFAFIQRKEPIADKKTIPAEVKKGAGDAMAYTVKNGVIVITSGGKPWQGFACGIVTQPAGDMLAGDMLWTTPKKAKPEVIRIERKL